MAETIQGKNLFTKIWYDEIKPVLAIFIGSIEGVAASRFAGFIT